MEYVNVLKTDLNLCSAAHDVRRFSLRLRAEIEYNYHLCEYSLQAGSQSAHDNSLFEPFFAPDSRFGVPVGAIR